MAKVRWLYNNLWKYGSLYNYSSQHNSFPATASQHPWRGWPWRSRYGSGSGSGTFVITASSNDRLDFDQGAAELTANLTAATYTASTLASHIQTQMNAVGTGLTVTYSESTNKFTITKASGTLNLKWATGTNTARTVGGTIGFNTAADDTGSLSYTSDYARIHTSEYVDVDLSSAQSADTVAIVGHNFSSGATVRLQGSSSSTFATTPVNELLTINSTIVLKIFTSGSYRYWRVLIEDVDNADGYIQVGYVLLGTYLELSRDISGDWSLTDVDPSDVIYSDGHQLSANSREKFVELSMNYRFLTAADLSSLRAMFASIGTTGGVLVMLDYSNHAYDWSWYMNFVSSPQYAMGPVDFYNVGLQLSEAL